MAGYIRQSAADIVPTAVVRAAPINNEFNALRDAFAQASGHKHDGTAAEGHYVPLISDVNNRNKVVVDAANNRISFFISVIGSAVEQLRLSTGVLLPATDNAVDLGSSTAEFKDLWIDGTANIDSLIADTADINAGTIDGAVIGSASPNAITGTTITATTGFVGGLTGNVTGNLTGGVTGNVTGDVTGNLTGNVTGNVTASSGTSTFNNVTINGTLDMSSGTTGTITGLSTPSNASDAATKSYVDAADALKLNLSGGTMSGAIAMGSNKITGLGTPTNDADAATKLYVDNAVQGLDAKASARVATTGNITLSGTQTIDGVAVVAGNRVLVKDQSTAAENGIYVVASGSWTRADDANTWDELVGAFVFVEQGTVNADNGFVCTVNAGGSLGSTTVTFVQFSGAGQVVAGAGMTKSGNTLNVNTASSARIVVGADEIDLATTGVSAGTYRSVTTDIYGRITGGTNPTTISGYGITDAYTKTEVDTALSGKLSLTGGTMTGNIAMGANKVTSTATPTTDDDLTRKGYVDGILGSATSAAASAAAAAISESNAAGSASSASSSASSALASANAAAASYDSFDDRYLGAKSSNPTLDNDGNALITGALYFNSVAGEMRVWSGSAWSAAYLPAAGYATLTGTETLTNKTIVTTTQTALQYATSNLPSIKPTLLLDFANVKSLDSRITFTRASEGRYYDGKTFAKAEENLLTYSQEFNNWGLLRMTITANATTAPDGTSTADQTNQTAGQTTFGGAVGSGGGGSFAANATYSVFAKANTKNFVVLQTSSAGVHRTWFNLSTGAVGTTNANHTASIVNVGNGWYRCIVTSSQASDGYTVYHADTDGSTVVTDSGGIFLWGAQLEQRSSVTAYTATTTQPITNYIPVLMTAAAGVARFDHNPVTEESLGLLIEEQRTNLLTYSEQFDNAAWTKTRASITANTIVAPDGTLTGDKLAEDTTASNTHEINQLGVTVVSGTTYAGSVYLKAAERTRARVVYIASGAGVFADADLSAGTIGAATGFSGGTAVSSSIQPVGNGWYRCTVVGSQAAGTSAALRVELLDASGNRTYTGNGYSGIYIWGAQLEAGSFPTSYIPTVAAQVTRSADAASMTGTNFSSWYNAAAGTLYAEVQSSYVPPANQAGIFRLNTNTANNEVRLRFVNSTIAGQVQSASGETFNQSVSASSSVYYRAALAYENNNASFSANGSAATTDDSVSLPTAATQATIGTNATVSGNFLNGTIKKLAYYPARLTNAQLQALTS